MEKVMINKVAESGLITLNLEVYYPTQAIATFDMKDFLFMGLILKEKDFRESMKTLDLSTYSDKAVAVTCSADAVIPVWAYMLVASYLQPVAASIHFCTPDSLLQILLLENIRAMDTSALTDKRVVIKGCGELPVGEAAYLEATKILRPLVKSIMYGEPCSTVPIYKKK